eukprot:CAMPEP_0204887144 /NCGR_PEP_ID=MMETSP1349-20130617/16986_1 /ASSEMBLY_ACC=CAM_ASM_000710 /TAXON_ID=215587 /ORGANISM="Aplanochytrium stocchinoi, Strain GSBS06" /LENGTH=143 /DNA_ID=CAMNT_0052049671 /DNA_START=173 /DNA_END=601 /DNA_ORIENTATION=-
MRTLILFAVQVPLLSARADALLRGTSNSRRMERGTGYITVVFPETISSEEKKAFTDQATFWNNVIATSTVEPITIRRQISAQAVGCNVATDYIFQLGDVINGVAIIAEVIDIDGPGNVLGQAAPCVPSRNIDGTKFIPRVGFM